MEIPVGILQLYIRTLHEGEDVLYQLQVRHKRALRHLLAVDVNTDVFHQTDTGAGRSDPLLVFAGVGAVLLSLTEYFIFTMKWDSLKAMTLLAELILTPLESVRFSR